MNTTLEKDVTDILRGIGVPAHIRGYYYIREAVVIAADDSDILAAVTKELYPAVAKVYSTTPSRVERAIRHAIEVTWKRNLASPGKGIWCVIKNKPTNSEFIALLAEKIRLERM